MMRIILDQPLSHRARPAEVAAVGRAQPAAVAAIRPDPGQQRSPPSDQARLAAVVPGPACRVTPVVPCIVFNFQLKLFNFPKET